MTKLTSPDFNILNYRRADEAADSMTARQADLISVAVRRAADDTGAAMAHQLREPLTVLLLYLHDLRKRCAACGADPVAFRDAVDMALRATERTREILEFAAHDGVKPLISGPSVVQGSQAIELWSRDSPATDASLPAPTFRRNPLTAREQEVLALVTNGSSNKGGGQELGISTRTFEAHRAHVMRKLGARNTADLIRIALNRKP